MKTTTLLLFLVLLSGCASAPQQTANTCPVEAKSAPVEAKTTQFVFKPRAPYDFDKMIKGFRHCNEISKLCAYALREKTRGTPKEKALRASEKVAPGLYYGERVVFMDSIYNRQKNNVLFIASLREHCLDSVTREQLTAKAP